MSILGIFNDKKIEDPSRLFSQKIPIHTVGLALGLKQFESETNSGMTSGGHFPIRGSPEKIPELGIDKLKINFVKAYSVEIFPKNLTQLKRIALKNQTFNQRFNVNALT